MEWKVINEFDERYEVSNTGIIRNRKTKYVISQHLINSGYIKIGIKFKGVTHNRLVHRLVAQYFCKGYEKDLHVNHKNAIRTDNNATNLEWVTPKDNIRDSIERGTHDVKSAHKIAHKLRKKPVAQINDLGEVINTFDSAREASKYIGVHENCISRVCRGHRPRSKGFRWVYINEKGTIN